MKVTFHGTRGSVPIANPRSVKTGGNTTCLEIESPCLPDGLALAIDAGTGFIPFSLQALARALSTTSLKEVHTLFTHYHHDHTQGLLLSPLTFNKAIPKHCWGPVESGFGPREVLQAIMKPPLFPVDFERVGSHFTCHRIENPNGKVIVCHEEGGIRMFTLEDFERGGTMVKFGRTGTYPVNQCLVIKMLYSNHPERTISYRLEERPSGKVFVFLTDNENQAALSAEMRQHLSQADLLVMDSQYTSKRYEEATAGFGHGTPDFCVRTALAVGAKRLGLTHHDPLSTDDDVATILAEGLDSYMRIAGPGEPRTVSMGAKDIFICTDGQCIDLSNVNLY